MGFEEDIGEGGLGNDGGGGGEYELVGGLGRDPGCVRGQTIWSHLSQSFLLVQRAQLLMVNQWVVLRRLATSTGGCSVGMKW